MSLGSHQSARAKTTSWLTPPELIRRLGPFDLDPCCPENMPWKTAKVMYSKDGLTRPWFGTIWLNPPFGRESESWVERLADWGTGITLLAARTETRMFFGLVWGRATSILFLRGRP